MSAARAARLDDLDEVARVEIAAGALYAPYGLAEHLSSVCTPRHELERGVAEGLAWVLPEEGALVGYALASAAGADLHLDEIGVVPSRVRRGLGTQLLEAVLDAGRQRGAARITLLTVDFVPWTLGFYARHGFRVLAVRELDARLARMLGIDAASEPASRRSFHGRIVLVRDLQGGA